MNHLQPISTKKHRVNTLTENILGNKQDLLFDFNFSVFNQFVSWLFNLLNW